MKWSDHCRACSAGQGAHCDTSGRPGAPLIRIGLIGAGNISATHARAVAGIADARVAAVYGPSRARAEQLAASCGAHAVDSVDELFEREPLDLVMIGTPSGLHGAHGAAAAQRGVHVLVEKPLEISVARADALIDTARDAAVSLGVIFQDRLKPDVRLLKARIDEGALGTPLLVRAQVPWWRPPDYYRQSSWRGTWALDGGGALMNQAIHTVDLACWLCGPVTRVSGRTATRFHSIEVEDTAVAVLEFANGAFGTIDATTCAYPGWPRRLEVTGTLGTAILEGDRLVTAGDAARQSPPENAASPAVNDPSPHRAVLVDFINAIRTGSPPSCDGSQGRRSVAVVEAVYASARSGTPVVVKGERISD
jgi:UDP-N-acetyl-2-amino-2-deoxyglucuronate dehydrogenase